MCNCKICLFDRENRGKNETIILGRALIYLLITPETILDYNKVYQQIYKKSEFKEVLTNDNLHENRPNTLLIRMLRHKQLTNIGCPESFISFAKIPEPYFRLKCYQILTNSNGHENLHYSAKNHLKVLLLEMARWMRAECFVNYPHIAFVNTIKMISNINVYAQSTDQHSDWLLNLNQISFITKNQLTIEESRQFVNIIYEKVHEMYIAIPD
jgi:hypothetical protein